MISTAINQSFKIFRFSTVISFLAEAEASEGSFAQKKPRTKYSFLRIVHRITSSHPDDPRQPFWNETGAPIKPLAKLTLNRQRLYNKACGDAQLPFDEDEFQFELDEGRTLHTHLAQAPLIFGITEIGAVLNQRTIKVCVGCF